MSAKKKKKLNPSAAKLLKDLNALLVGLGNLPASVTTIMVANVVYTVKDLIAALTAHKALLDGANNAKLALAAAEDARDASFDTMTTLVQDTRAAVKPMLGRKNAALVTFGMAPDKTPAPLTNAEEAVRIAKSKATRKARGTLGPKQKAAIHGVLPETPAPAPTPEPLPIPAPLPKTG